MTDNTELQKAAAYAAQDTIKFADEDEEMRALQQFHEEVDPETVLALIAENERLAKQWGDRPAYRTPEYESKRDAMWRRAHMVATSKGYDHINMAIAAAPNACPDCMGCGGEWQGEGVPNAVCETCKGSRGKALEADRDQLEAENERLAAACERAEQVISAESKAAAIASGCANLLQTERDQLRAENAGLKTGYEAYERVNAELKAEVARSVEREILQLAEIEALRKDAERLQSAAVFVQKLCDSAGRQPSVATGYLHDILSAMGQGEQS
ncbi:hypothetical protein [Pseudomonas extremaustralis]|uniref:hypothetical protein n=1 Tax=Pseudomonas extremaustralis TaxID=359110 RepID=UPI002AA7C465|nr:hypothetical protein [Pseudomonas extremaustralis]